MPERPEPDLDAVRSELRAHDRDAQRASSGASEMADGVSVAQLELDGEERFQLLRRELGVSAFGLNLLRFQPGERSRIHRHERQEEVYLVLEGTLTLDVEGSETHELGPGGIARVAPAVRRQLTQPRRVAARRPGDRRRRPARGPRRPRVPLLGGPGGRLAARDPLPGAGRARVISVRYLLPAGIFLLGCALLIIDGGGKTGWEGFFMGTGAALAVLLLNWLFRLGAEGDREREAEEAAREEFARTGRWPDD